MCVGHPVLILRKCINSLFRFILQQFKVMTPCQNVRRLTFWKSQIQLTHIGKIGTAEPFPTRMCQVL